MEVLGDKLTQQLGGLEAQIVDMQAKVSRTNQDLSDNTIVGDELDNNKQMKHFKNYIKRAENIFSKGTVYSESVASTVVGHPDDVASLAGTVGSVLEMNDTQRRRVHEWIPGERIYEGGISTVLILISTDFELPQTVRKAWLSKTTIATWTKICS